MEYHVRGFGYSDPRASFGTLEDALAFAESIIPSPMGVIYVERDRREKIYRLSRSSNGSIDCMDLGA